MEEKPTQSFSLKSGFVANRQGDVREVMQEVKASGTTSYFLRPPLCLFCPLIPFKFLNLNDFFSSPAVSLADKVLLWYVQLGEAI